MTPAADRSAMQPSRPHPPPHPGSAADVIALCQAAVSRLAVGDVDQADAIIGPALAARPDDANLLTVAANCALARNLDDQARSLFERSIERAPGFAPPLLNLGFLHRRHQRIAEARDVLRRCVAITPSDPNAWMNLTATYVNEGEPAAGETVAREGLSRCPTSHAIRWNLALLLLEQGKWADGWREYRVRFDAGVVEPPRYGPQGLLPPRLQSPDQIREGQTVICRGEQGLGDEILFAGMLAELHADVRRRGGRLIVDCNPRLRSVFAGSFAAETFGDGTGDIDAVRRAWTRPIDWLVPMGDLGGLYRSGWRHFPDRAGYITVAPEPVDRLREALATRARGRPLVGLAWSGGSPHTHAVHRHVPLVEWLPVLRQDACFVSLHYRDCDDELHSLAAEHGIEIVRMPEITRHADYLATFQLVAALDLIITVPTSVLHVAGAVGKECWVVMHHRAAWRECAPDRTIPWYPRTHHRFVRGPDESDWAGQIRLVAERLAARMPG